MENVYKEIEKKKEIVVVMKKIDLNEEENERVKKKIEEVIGIEE